MVASLKLITEISSLPVRTNRVKIAATFQYGVTCEQGQKNAGNMQWRFYSTSRITIDKRIKDPTSLQCRTVPSKMPPSWVADRGNPA